MLSCYVFDKQGKIHITIEVRCKIKVWWEVMITLGMGIGITDYGWTGQMGNTGTGTWSGRYDRLRERIQ